ncbi:PaaX family transcriptional regulator C-terminal domain-containing protein [Actinoplanes couchii]|uniref:Repressor in the phenylacetic acid catabolism n=1 Tax=Actinoplanes couchii TaxID=403638 RepID=A0ABQ3XGH3_9ACTN|nr:PaaX family transcriptional regulator C-terminal domain-containing protein [Actinoplanes couchii]MDR6321083.1 phenylacetic acid degradation operon negative regulatory protein [Actinoplanes couchii]GID57594.1 putative repressor in the phenylacetic acid catabolism [Actinoplanes couchii]
MTEVTSRFVVEGLLRADRTAALAEVYDVGNALGIADQPMRLTIRRLVAGGDWVQEGRGRAGVLRHVGEAGRHDPEFVRFAYRRDAGEHPWDGWWHLVVFTVPESERARRDAVRRNLLRLGGAPLHPGVYVSPDGFADVPEGAWTASTRDLRHEGVHHPPELAARLWPLDEIALRYERLALLSAQPPPTGRIESLRRALELAAAFDHAMVPDPLLPRELLPENWPPATARAAFRDRWAALRKTGGHRLFENYDVS